MQYGLYILGRYGVDLQRELVIRKLWNSLVQILFFLLYNFHLFLAFAACFRRKRNSDSLACCFGAFGSRQPPFIHQFYSKQIFPIRPVVVIILAAVATFFSVDMPCICSPTYQNRSNTFLFLKRSFIIKTLFSLSV